MKMFLQKNFLLALLILPLLGIAQFVDEFSDGEFLNNPAWVGRTDSFYVDNGWLRSNGPQASSKIYLSTATGLMDSTEWNFLLKLDFNPSSTNFVRVYLASDQQNLTSNLNGYFVQFGEAGTAPDSLDIFRQNGSTVTKVFTGLSGCLSGSSSNSVRVKVVRHAGGTWDVYADCTGGNTLNPEGNFTDNNIVTTSWFGVYCSYTTASRYNMYYFDDFEIKYIQPDVIPPAVQSVTVVSNTVMEVRFTETVELGSAQTIGNYTVNNSIGNPSSAVRDVIDLTLVRITFLNPLQNATNYQLQISSITDLAGNTMNPFSYSFAFFTPVAYDILINEVMADPDPVVGLPSVEFVELYNRTAFPISLNGWKFSDASATATIGNATILPDSFVILCAIAHLDSFPSNITKVGLTSLPSLNNASDNLTLKDNLGNIIHNVNYTDSWYNSSVKRNGGWTLELINPLNPCRSTNNWTASNDLSGGTPGRRNSVYNTSTSAQLSLVSVTVVSPTVLVLVFNESLDKTSVETAVNYSVSNTIGNPATSVLDSLDFTKVYLTFSTAFDSNVIYTVTASPQNCAGVAISTQNSLEFALPLAAQKFDVIINELLPDPDPVVALPNAEFLELYNRSNKAIQLKDWQLSKTGTSGATLTDYLLLPDSFLIITSSTNGNLFSTYRNIMAVSSFPALANSADQLLLTDNAGQLIHYVSYEDTWYNDLSKKDGGWTLEMIDTENPCTGKENWRASVDVSGGTPGRKNSVAATNPDFTPPQLLRAALSDENTLMLYFSEPLNNGPASDVTNYSVNNGVGNPALALPVPFDFSSVQLEFTQSFLLGTRYTIRVSNLTDCSGNSIGMSDTARFAIPDTIAPGDVVINEILFNPRTAGSDFLELYNRSDKVIDLSQIDVIELEVGNPLRLLELGSASLVSFLLFPGEYVALTTDPVNILLNYHVENPAQLIKMSLPNYPDDEGICVVKVKNGPIIDSLHYDKKWHYALLDDQNGVSLERIDFLQSTQDKNNWHSAASTFGFATPTYLNSQFSEIGIAESSVRIEPEVFSPDNDGDKDVTFVSYNLEEPGYSCSIRIYDAVGREIRTLVSHETLGTSGQFQWDGTDDQQNKARVGIYMVFVEIFNLDGKVKRFKRPVVLGAKLN